MKCFYLPWTLQPELTLGHLTWAWLTVSIVWLVEVKIYAYRPVTFHLYDVYFADCFWNTAVTDFWKYLYVTLSKATDQLWLKCCEGYLLVHLALPPSSYWLANFSIQQITAQTLPTYSRCVTCFENVSYSTWPVMTATCYFATSRTTHPETHHHIPEDQSPQLHCCANLSTHIVLLSFDVFHLPVDLLLQFLVFH